MHRTIKRRIARTSAQRRKAANVRWEMDRARREHLASTDPIYTGWKIARRIIVIDRETTVREVVIYESDSRRDWLRKQKLVLR